MERERVCFLLGGCVPASVNLTSSLFPLIHPFFLAFLVALIRHSPISYPKFHFPAFSCFLAFRLPSFHFFLSLSLYLTKPIAGLIRWRSCCLYHTSRCIRGTQVSSHWKEKMASTREAKSLGVKATRNRIERYSEEIERCTGWTRGGGTWKADDANGLQR